MKNYKDIDKIFFLTLLNNKERLDNVKDNIERINNIFYLEDKIQINYNSNLKFLYNKEKIFNELKLIYYSKPNCYNHSVNSFGCFLSHYNAIAQAYYLGYNNIIILEDDAYINDANYFIELINNIPDDADFIQYFFIHSGYKKTTIGFTEYYEKVKDIKTYSNICYFLSKKMISKIYNEYYNNICYADTWQKCYNDSFYKDINIYITRKPIIDNFKFESTIDV